VGYSCEVVKVNIILIEKTCKVDGDMDLGPILCAEIELGQNSTAYIFACSFVNEPLDLF
jgi:hypothetical protein